jgi:hypothetical protein
MTNHFKNVALFARAETRLFNLELAKELKTKSDCKLYLYCNGDEQTADYQSLPEASLFEDIVNGGFLLETAVEPVSDPESVVQKSTEWEERLGYPISKIVLANRHLGRGFSLGGFHHPRSRYSENSSHIQVLNAYTKTLSFWDKEFREKQITLVLNGYKEAACVARFLELPYRAMAGSRYKNFHYWAWNEHYDNPMFTARYHSTESEAGDITEKELSAPYFSHQVNRKIFLSDVGMWSFLKRSAMVIVYFAYWKIRGFSKARGYSLKDRLKGEVRRWLEYKKLQRCANKSVEDLKNQPYVYYPLHVEPETSLQVISPEFFYQLSLITAVARDLPASAILTVKEAYGSVGRRPDNFYDQILDFKNVTLFETMERGIECAQNSAAVVTISGTAGLEAAVAGVPVISFGRHNFYNVLPHVQVVTDETRLHEYLKDAIGGKFNKSQMVQDGQRLLDAVVSESFDMREYSYVDLGSFEHQSVVDACAALTRSVNASSDQAYEAYALPC